MCRGLAKINTVPCKWLRCLHSPDKHVNMLDREADSRYSNSFTRTEARKRGDICLPRHFGPDIITRADPEGSLHTLLPSCDHPVRRITSRPATGTRCNGFTCFHERKDITEERH